MTTPLTKRLTNKKKPIELRIWHVAEHLRANRKITDTGLLNSYIDDAIKELKNIQQDLLSKKKNDKHRN